MNRIIFIIQLLLISVYVFAQKDPEAEKVFQQMEKKVKNYKCISSDFEYLLKNPDESAETYTGKVIVKGKMFKMSFDKTITFSDGKTRWVYLEESNEVNISEVVSGEELDFEEKFLVEPLSIYSIYKEGFKYMLNKPTSIDGVALSVVDLIPEDVSENFFKVRCWITNDYDLHSIKYFLKDGTRMQLTLKNFQINKKWNDKDFIFDAKKYPEVEIIDMR